MIEVFCDGASRGNPGHSAWAFVVKQKGRIIHEGSGYLGIATNNQAEYTAIIQALKWLKDNFVKEPITIYMDSLLAASQLSGIYKVKNAQIRDFILEIRILENNFKKISYHHIRREKNRQADRLANQILDEHLKIKS